MYRLEEPTRPGEVRPGGRTARVRSAVLTAVVDELLDHGYASFAMDRVSARAGVGRTTLYRRWGSPSALVRDLLQSIAEQTMPIPDTGSVEEDLRIITQALLEAHLDQRLQATIQGIIAAAGCAPEIDEALRTFFQSRATEAAVVITRAVERGELPPGTDGVDIFRMLAAPLCFRLLVSREPVDQAVADRTAAVILHAARTGLFTTPDAQ
ncbi:TetR/AcrR family transcriptional regulator [Bailinhaonella thermotolerans]|uniref:TetR/AcrR family transcriptional regulator n=1 Tax=Bailinhaonella thermotolerans TaxID=1070861 RepID=A0A3A4A2J9_9ACTN|nr:TetR/AcrR family transcriptional regulator [Bailinhaonella thermotolerans]RJL22550.1 TetR/AcrR family transcriptional regulator [Bailinhaonella thermotolerans]